VIRFVWLFGLTLWVALWGAAVADQLPVPPVPPDQRPVGDVAPVPNPDLLAPASPASDQPSVSVRLFRNRPYDPSVGFTPGSRYQSSEDRKPIQTPGLSLSVPIK